MKEKLIKGKLHFYSEQGMEGGNLAIMDENHIKLHETKYGLEENRKVWDKLDQNKIGITSNPERNLNNSWLPLRDPILDEPDYQTSSLFQGEEKGDFNADKRLMDKYNFLMKYTKEKANDKYGNNNWKFTKPNSEIMLKDGSIIMMGGTPTCIPDRPYSYPNAELSRVTVNWNNGSIEIKRLSNTLLIEGWDYNGLHILKETDLLKVYNSSTNEKICEGQINQIPLKLFSQKIKGHFENLNENIEVKSNWEKYFTEQYSAELYRETELTPTMAIVNTGFWYKIKGLFK